PVLRVATFAGYVHHGASGAAAATLALFSAPWVVGRLAGGWLGRGRNHPVATAAGRGLPSAGGGAIGPAGLVPGRELPRGRGVGHRRSRCRLPGAVGFQSGGRGDGGRGSAARVAPGGDMT